MTALAEAFQKAGIAGSGTEAETPPAPEPRRRMRTQKKDSQKPATKGHWGRAKRPNMIEWEHPLLGSVYVELKQILLGRETYQSGPNTWCRMLMGHHQLKEIRLDFNYNLKEGVEILYGLGDQLVNLDTTEPTPFVLPVAWNKGRGKDAEARPTITAKSKDFQLFVMHKELVIHLDVAVVTRDGLFWLTLQEVTGMQVLRHDSDVDVEGLTSVIVGEHGYTLVPAYDENCYPGFDPVASIERSYPGRTKKLLQFAAEFGAFVEPDSCSPGAWNPQWPAEVPAELAQQGYVKAVVQWFNLTIGWGFLQLEDGRACFVHFKAIEDDSGKKVAAQGDFPVLSAGGGVYLKWAPNKEKGNSPAATAVRAA